jgi:hypothetical protein
MSARVPAGFNLVNPYENAEVKEILRVFYRKFYNDTNERLFVFGINPGRFGGGLTGISFTDPVALRVSCGIENSLGSREELSSKFIYMVVDAFGGADKFFSKIFLSALYPLAILQDGKNCNFYDDKALFESLKSEIVSSVDAQVRLGASRDKAVCLGRKNAVYFNEINDEYRFFDEIEVLDHPRWIMQYRLKKVRIYLKEYLRALKL